MVTDCRKILTDLQTRFGDNRAAERLLDELVELVDGDAELQLSVYKGGYAWGAEMIATMPDNFIRTAVPGREKPETVEVISVRGGSLVCKSSDGDKMWTGLIRRDWVIEEDREKYDEIVSRGSVS